ncbi:tetratricopeptide repeat protein, partial [bacterium]|nr:tetratricopeptide repeat protein [bacterium]
MMTVFAFGQTIPIRIESKRANPKAANAKELNLADQARHYEERAETERALAAWRAVLGENAWNAQAIEGIRRNLVYLKRYDEAIEFIEGIIARSQAENSVQPNTHPALEPFVLTLGLGEIYLVQDQQERAWEIWNRALESESKNPRAVVGLVQVLQRNRLWEDAERLIEDYRKESGQPSFMAYEMSQSMRVRMQWDAATRELINYLQEAPQSWMIAQRTLTSFPDEPDVHQKVAETLAHTVKKDKRNIRLRQLYAGYLFHIRDFAGSYEQTVVADSLDDKHGEAVLALADRLLKQGETSLASKSFSRALQREPSAQTKLKAELGLADCQMQLEKFAEAKAAYQSFVAAHPKAAEAVLARYRMATITLRHERKPAEAFAQLKEIEKGSKQVSPATVQLNMGDCLVWMDKIPDAIDVWSKVSNDKKYQDKVAEANLRIVRAHLWMDSLVKANDALDMILAGSFDSPCYNDAVRYSKLMTEGGYGEVMREYAQGDLSLFLEEPDKAANHFQRVADVAKQGRMAETGRYMQAFSLRDAGQTEASVRVLEQFVEDFPESRDLDRTIFLIAQVQEEDLHNTAAALASYEKILADFPESTYLEQARKRARAIEN